MLELVSEIDQFLVEVVAKDDLLCVAIKEVLTEAD